MTNEAYRESLTHAKADYEAAQKRVAAAENELTAAKYDLIVVRRGVLALAAMVGEEVDLQEIGLTEACRQVMEATLVPLQFKDVKAQMVALGFDFGTQKNPDAAVSVVLKRLEESGEVRRVTQMRQKIGGKPTPIVLFLGKRLKNVVVQGLVAEGAPKK